MKRFNFLTMVCSVAIGGILATSCDQSANNVTLANTVDSVSYSIGVSNGAGMRESLKTLPGAEGKANIDALVDGFVKAIKGDSALLKMNPQQAQEYINQYIMGIQQKEVEVAKAEGDAFLASNKSKEGVITTESGLQYKVITEGTGKKPSMEDQVKVHYTGKLLDGFVFDSSVQRGEPAVFGVNQVIRGWSEILQIMPEGSKYMVWIPSDLGYGAQGMPNQNGGWLIKPNSVLDFEVELLEVTKK